MPGGHVEVNGQKLYYEIDGEGDDLLLIGGLGQDVTGWAFQVPRFIQHYRVIVFDNRDAGRSAEASGPYTTADMADDVAGLMDALQISRAHVLGYSLGGAIAQEFALRHQIRVNKLILACTSAHLARYQINLFDPVRFIREHDREGRILASQQLFMTMTREFLKLRGAVQMMLDLLSHPPFPQSPAALSRQIDACRTFDALDRLDRVSVPTCVLVGDQDILTPPWVARELAAAIPGARLQMLADGGHGLLFEIPEKFNRAVLDFLLDQRAPQPAGGSGLSCPARSAAGS
ncbi:MAG: alpha/beta fold hydrolase [Gammaproteobacteria bacterium]|nr:alpha/beta fold hydrolase [Gammaproteobacteria bacterium]